MAGLLSASLGAAAAWTIMVLVLSGLGIGLGLVWRTWGSRSPIAERLRSLLKRGSDGDEEDADEPEAAPPVSTPTPMKAPAPRRAAETSAPRHRTTPVPPMPERVVGRPATNATARPDLTPAGAWVEDFRAAGWQLVDDLDEDATEQLERPGAPRDRAADWGADAWAEWDDAAIAPSSPPERNAAEEPEPVDGQNAPPPVEGHPNDAAFDETDETPAESRRGTRVIPIVPPSPDPGPDPDDHEVSPWSFEDEAGGPPTAEGPAPGAKGVPRSAARDDNPFAEDRDAPVEDEVDRLLGSGRRLVPVGPPKAPPSAPEAPEEPTGPSEEEVAKETAALATLPDQHLKPPSVSPLDPDRGRDGLAEETERRPFETHEDPGAARKGPAVAVPKKRELSRTEAIEELTAIYGVSYEEACSLLDAGLWGFENHEEWIRAVRASGKPACVEDATFEKVMSIPMKAIRDDLDKLREKRRATQELERLWGVGADEASALYEAGFTTLEEIREASVDQLARIKEISHSTAFMIKAAAHGLAPDTT